jgi:hypothetical protein
MLSGAEGWEAIEDFGHEKLAWMRKYIELKNGNYLPMPCPFFQRQRRGLFVACQRT